MLFFQHGFFKLLSPYIKGKQMQKTHIFLVSPRGLEGCASSRLVYGLKTSSGEAALAADLITVSPGQPTTG